MKVRKFNESLDNDSLKKQVEEESKYYIVGMIDDKDISFKGGVYEDLDVCLNDIERYKRIGQIKMFHNEKTKFFIKIKKEKIEIITPDEVERLIDTKKYNL